MARPKSKQPTDGELEILRILWERGHCELGTIVEGVNAQRRSDVAKTTVATMLKVMLEKGLVKRVQGDRSYVWSAKSSRRVTSRGVVGRVIDRVFDGSAKHLVAHLIEDGKLSDHERAEILRLLAQDSESSSRV